MIIETADLTKFFGKLVALEGLSLRVPQGVCGFLGPNGAGKTTAIHVLLGLLKPDRGEARVFGLDCWSQSFEIRRRVGVLLEDPIYPRSFTAERYLELFARLRGVSQPKLKTKRMLKDMDLYWAKDRKIGGFSAGMMQRLGLASALIGDPELVILDEPASNLDPIGRAEVLERIERLYDDKGVDFLISSHVLPELEKVCRWVSIVDGGRVVEQGLVSELTIKYMPHVYEVEVAPNPNVLASALEGREFVEKVSLKGNRVQCEAKNPERFCREISHILFDLKLELIRFQPAWGVLEEVYRGAVKSK